MGQLPNNLPRRSAMFAGLAILFSLAACTARSAKIIAKVKLKSNNVEFLIPIDKDYLSPVNPLHITVWNAGLLALHNHSAGYT